MAFSFSLPLVLAFQALPVFYHPIPVSLCFLFFSLFFFFKSFPLLIQSGKRLLAECTWAGLDRCVVSRKTGAKFPGVWVSVQLQTAGFRDEEVSEFMVVLLTGIVRLMGIGLLAVVSEPLP